MEYRIIRNDELYHHGVKGMKWGVRRQSKTSAGRRQNTDSRGAASPEQRKARIKKAAKIGVAVAGTALAAYGGYKVYKLQGEAVTSLGKKYAKLGKQRMELADLSRNTARIQANESDRYKLLAGYVRKNEPGNKWEHDIYKNAEKSFMNYSRESDARADKRLEEAMNYYSKAKNKDFSRKEIVREMADIAKAKKRYKEHY